MSLGILVVRGASLGEHADGLHPMATGVETRPRVVGVASVAPPLGMCAAPYTRPLAATRNVAVLIPCPVLTIGEDVHGPPHPDHVRTASAAGGRDGSASARHARCQPAATAKAGEGTLPWRAS